jgi:hypothetical protein
MVFQFILTASFLFISILTHAQDSSSRFYPQYIDKVSGKASLAKQSLDRKTERALLKMEKEEQRLNNKLKKIDSAAAIKLFGDTEMKYAELRQTLTSEAGLLDLQKSGMYFPYLDTLKTTLSFLESKGDKFLNASPRFKEKLQGAISKANDLNSQIAKVQSIQQYLRERRQYLKEQLSQFGMAKELKRLNKELFYYVQEFKELKETLKNPKKIEAKAMAILREMPVFKKFMQQNSQLASLFSVPSAGNAGSISLAGLQTRASVQQFMQTSLPLSGNSPQQFIGQQLQSATDQFAKQKNGIRFPELAENYGETPDFKPNMQKSKSFFKRLEYGANIQFGKTNNFLPTTGDIAVSLGYKLNNSGIIGVGSSYKLGLGNGIKHIRFTHQGFGFRSFIDWKIKGGFFVSGGYEQNNLPQLQNIVGPVAISTWQESGLIGITKKYPLGKKRKGNLQLLFNFLSYKNIPRSQPILIRTGINF